MNLKDLDLLLEKETNENFFVHVLGLVNKLGKKMKLSLMNKMEEKP
jgi:hypothetical protein